ncbi:hypothetical protein PCASD_00890 [Puccinia coronata f. sp. avenae]|uniref:Uncharacterized protein n=1 Tax=Puccinia coronata f. sp. avenae TaxID=200324 RepID=A0A2N5VPE7_9BASI|nr:hypothetical protein PCASD_00890 [Puccinia coronata f. sp. avenae]
MIMAQFSRITIAVVLVALQSALAVPLVARQPQSFDQNGNPIFNQNINGGGGFQNNGGGFQNNGSGSNRDFASNGNPWADTPGGEINHCGGYTEGENDFGTASDCGPHRMPGEFNGAMPGDPWNENPMGAAQKENDFGTNGFGQVREPGEDGNNGAFNSQFGFNNGFGSNGGS